MKTRTIILTMLMLSRGDRYHSAIMTGEEPAGSSGASSSSSSSSGSSPVQIGCEPGTSTSCACFGATDGVAICSAARVFGSCDCPTGGSSTSGGCSHELCNGKCCNPDERCVPSSGAKICARSCVAGSDCGLGACCSQQPNGQGACVGAANNNDGLCLCKTTSDCAGGARTPSLGYYTCQPDSGEHYRGCYSRPCGYRHDCVADNLGNRYCVPDNLGSDQCVAGWCIGPLLGTGQQGACHNPPGEQCNTDCMLCSTKPW